MSFQGYSILQASQIASASTGLSALQATVAANAATANAALATVNTTLSSHDSRLTTAEGKITALETDIAGRVETEINSKVSQVVFDSLASELRNADSALTSAVATKVASVTQAAVDQAQNDLIALKASQADVTAYITSNNAAVAAKLSSSTFATEKAALQASIDSKVATTDYNTQVGLMTAGLASKVAQADYDSQVNSLQTSIGLKATQADLEGLAASTTSALATKVSISAYNAAQEAQDAAIASKLETDDFNSAKSQLDALNNAWENRFLALEEFTRALLNTYTITKPDGNPYEFTGLIQNLSVPPPVFSVVAKNGNTLRLQLTPYGYNTMGNGDLVAWTNLGGSGLGKGQVNPSNLIADLTIPTGASHTFNLEYRNNQHTPVYTVQMTPEVWNALPNF